MNVPNPDDNVDSIQAAAWDLHALLQHVEKVLIDLRAASDRSDVDGEIGAFVEAASYVLTARCAVDDAVNAIEVR
jgi:hypothetical protein